MALLDMTFQDYLQNQGIYQDASGAYYRGEGEGRQRIGADQLAEMQQSPWLRDSLTSQGYIPMQDFSGIDWSRVGGAGGQQFTNSSDYYNYLYGGGQAVDGPDGQYWQSPTGGDIPVAGAERLNYTPPPNMTGDLIRAAILASMGYAAGGAAGLWDIGGVAAGVEAPAMAADVAWGVNPATAGEFSLAGGTAGTTGGGLSSAAGGVTGITPGGAGVTGLTGTAGMGSGALLTPSLAVSAGLPASAAMGGAGLTAAEAAGGVAGGSWGANPATASPISKILDGTATASDYASLAGSLAGTVGGLASANQQSNAFADLANKGWEMGAPSRARYEGSFAPDFDLLKADPLLQRGLDASADASARSLSTKYGNPAMSPAALAEQQKYLLGSVYLPQGNTYRSQNATSGQFGTNLAGTATGGQINAQGGGWEALGSGLENILNPKKSIYEQLAQAGGLLGGLKFGNGTSF